LLGVHACIQAAGAEGELPPYVPRDVDADLRTAITAAGREGGLVLLVGGSSVGKTRALFEAVRAVLAEWWLIHPVDVLGGFSPDERRRGEALAGDPRIRIALDTPDAGFTQVLAAGPELVRRWEQASDPYGKAVITAALDARRVGAAAPLTHDFLAAAGPGYLTPAQQATAPVDWLDQALGYATTPLHGAAATLNAVPAGMGSVAGYTVADYLHQRARSTRRTTPLPDLVWRALIDHHNPTDTRRLADNADLRGRPAEAATLYRLAADTGDGSAEHGRVEAIEVLHPRADAGDGYARYRLADLLAEHGRVDEAIEVLRPRADAGDGYAAYRLADLLAEHGRVDELQAEVHAGTLGAAYRLAALMRSQPAVTGEDRVRDQEV
jgi:hypothetical protein